MILDHLTTGCAQVYRLGEATVEPVAADDDPRHPERENCLTTSVHRRVMTRLERESLHHQAIPGRTTRVTVDGDDRRRELVDERKRLDRGQHRLDSTNRHAGRAAVGVESHQHRTL